MEMEKPRPDDEDHLKADQRREAARGSQVTTAQNLLVMKMKPLTGESLWRGASGRASARTRKHGVPCGKW